MPSSLEKVLKAVADQVDDKPEKEASSKTSKKTSGWKVFFYVIGAVILIAVAVIPAILARRRAAKIAHERDTLLEEKKQLELKAKLEQEEKARGDLRVDVAAKRLEAEALQKKIEGLEVKRKKFADSVSAITDWSDIPEWSD